MNYGLYLSASGLISNMYKMDVLSSNLANAETPGFKPAIATARQRDVVRVEDGVYGLPSDAMLEKLGAGVMMMPNRLSFSQGVVERTDRPMDVALEGEGFLVVRGANDQDVRLSRDGRLAIDAQGRLVQATSGRAVLDRGDRPINVKTNQPLAIDSAGVVSQGGVAVAQLQVAKVADQSKLRPAGEGALTGPPALLAGRKPGGALVIQKSIERSAVDSIQTMMDISAAESGVGSNARMIQVHDQVLDRAINTFGRLT